MKIGKADDPISCDDIAHFALMKMYTIISNLLSRSRKFAPMSFDEEIVFLFFSWCKYKAKVSQESLSFKWASEEKKPVTILEVSKMMTISLVERRAQICEHEFLIPTNKANARRMSQELSAHPYLVLLGKYDVKVRVTYLGKGRA